MRFFPGYKPKHHERPKMSNPVNEIVLGKPEICNLGYYCSSCHEQIVGRKNGICGRCLQQAEFNTETDTTQQVGYLLDGNFYCVECATWWPDASIPVYRINIGIYSQVCTCCRKCVVSGIVPLNLLPCKYKDSRRVLGV